MLEKGETITIAEHEWSTIVALNAPSRFQQSKDTIHAETIEEEPKPLALMTLICQFDGRKDVRRAII